MSANITDEEHKGPLSNSDQNLRVGAKTYVEAGLQVKHKDSEQFFNAIRKYFVVGDNSVFNNSEGIMEPSLAPN